MKFKNSVIALVVMSLPVGVALLPGLFGDSSRPPLSGPELSTIEYEEVEFENGDLRLAGLIFVPKGEGPFPAAVIIDGSGSSRRNSRWYLAVTRHLQENAVAVLLPDKRGCENSEGSRVGADYQDLVEFIGQS